jgi:hypothetical protein
MQPERSCIAEVDFVDRSIGLSIEGEDDRLEPLQ